MKTKLVIATLGICAIAPLSAASAGTKEYAAICGNTRLTLAERQACRSEMKLATTDEARTQVFRTYDLKSIGYDINGQRLTKTVQEAEAK
jgi:hypothetical protein